MESQLEGVCDAILEERTSPRIYQVWSLPIRWVPLHEVVPFRSKTYRRTRPSLRYTTTERILLLMIKRRVILEYLNFNTKNALELLSLSHKQI